MDNSSEEETTTAVQLHERRFSPVLIVMNESDGGMSNYYNLSILQFLIMSGNVIYLLFQML